MEQGPSWEGNINSAGQEISHLIWNPKIHYRKHTIPPLELIMGQIIPFHILSYSTFHTHFNFILSSTSSVKSYLLH